MTVAAASSLNHFPVWRRLFAWTVFPVTFAGCLTGATVMLQNGSDGRLVTLEFSLLAAAIVIAAEKIQPHAKAWSVTHDDVPTDFCHMLLSQLLPPQLFDAFFRAGLYAVAATVSNALSRDSLWPLDTPLLLQLALVMIISEFGQYWWHRLCHENTWFWRFHATHHSAPRLYWLNAGRFHPLDTLVSYALQTIPLVLLGCPLDLLALFSLFTAVHGLFQHANIELRLGPLNWIFSMAELHRWHHSRNMRDANSNYGANIIFWDILFKTRHQPTDRQHTPDDVGFNGMPNFPQTYAGQLATPFHWQQLERQAQKMDAVSA